MAGHLQKLFGADGDLADEDFLSAVEDAENRFMVPGRLSPGGGSVPPSLQPLRPLGPQLGHRPGKTPGLRPLARPGEQPGGCRGPPAGAAAPQDELDNELLLAACMELEGPEAPAGAGAARPPPGPWEKPPETLAGQESPPARAAPKKLRHGAKLPEEILVCAPRTPAHGAAAKRRSEGLPSSSLPTEEDFGKGPWLAMKTEMGLDERDPGCFLRTYSVVMVLRKAALKQLPKNKVPSMAVMIKTLTRTNVDAGAMFRDPTGEMPGTVHRLLLEERQGELRPGSVLLLKQVGVFSPSHRNHYLNITPTNLLRIYPPEPESGFLRPPPARREVHAQAGPLQDHPAPLPGGVPAPGAWGQSGTGSTEQAPGGFSLHPQSPRPRRDEAAGADGCDTDDLDGLLGELPEDFFSAAAQADCC